MLWDTTRGTDFSNPLCNVLLFAYVSKWFMRSCAMQADAAHLRDTAPGTALPKGPRNNNSPTKGLLGSAGQSSLCLAVAITLTLNVMVPNFTGL